MEKKRCLLAFVMLVSALALLLPLVSSQEGYAPIVSESTITSDADGFYDSSGIRGWCSASDQDSNYLTYSWRWYLNNILYSAGSESHPGWRYQESTAQNGLTGKMADRDWESYADLHTTNLAYFFNYTKPDDTLESSLLQIKEDLGSPLTTNITIHSSCFGQPALIFRLTSEYPYNSFYTRINISCWDGASWRVIKSGMNDDFARLYEEAMWWNISGTAHRSGRKVNVANVTSGLEESQTWRLECIAYDGTTYSEGLNSSDITITHLERENTPPEILEVSIVPASASQGEDLGCYATASDTESSELIVEYTWYKGSTSVLSGDASVAAGENTLISTIESSRTKAGENWHCEAKAFDGEYYSEPLRGDAAILHDEPGIKRVFIYPENPGDNDDLYCNATLVGTASTVSAHWYWFNDGKLESSGYKEDIASNSNTIITEVSRFSTLPGEEWTCTIILVEEGEMYEGNLSSTVVIEEKPPVSEIISELNFWKRTYHLGYIQDIHTQQLAIGERLSLGLNGLNHYVGLADLDASRATINVSHPMQQRVLSKGEEASFSVANVTEQKLLVRLDGIYGNRAELSVGWISASAVSEAEPQIEPETPLEPYQEEQENNIPEEGYANEGQENIDNDMNKASTSSIWPYLKWIILFIVLVVMAIAIASAFRRPARSNNKEGNENNMGNEGNNNLAAAPGDMKRPWEENLQPAPMPTSPGLIGDTKGSDLVAKTGPADAIAQPIIDYETGTEVPINLMEYLIDVKSRGFSDEQIRPALLNAGWTDNQIDSGLKLINKR